MIPYVGATTFTLGGMTFQVWGTMVAACYAVATYVAWRRAKVKGLDPAIVLDLAFWIFIAAFIGSRLFHVLVYEPGYYQAHPFEAFDFRKPGYAIFGGFMGAFLATFWILRKKALSFIPYADVLIWGVPWGCGIGRIGCFLIHDHPGTLSNSLLAVKYPDGQSRHDLGLYLSLIGFATGIFFLLLNRRPRGPGFWLGMYCVIEALCRFFLDFLRISDVRYGGLTPTQWISIPLGLLGIQLLRRSVRHKVTHSS